MAQAKLYPIVNVALDGKLAELLDEWRETLTYRQIADKLRAEHGIDVSIETVRRWCSEPQGAAS